MITMGYSQISLCRVVNKSVPAVGCVVFCLGCSSWGQHSCVLGQGKSLVSAPGNQQERLGDGFVRTQDCVPPLVSLSVQEELLPAGYQGRAAPVSASHTPLGDEGLRQFSRVNVPISFPHWSDCEVLSSLFVSNLHFKSRKK